MTVSEGSSVPTRCLPACQGRAPVQHPKPVPLTLNSELGRRDKATITLCLPDCPGAWAGRAELPWLGPDTLNPCERAAQILKANPAYSMGLQLPEPRASLVAVVGVPGKLEAGVGKARL